jgi:hypothetical protein
MARVAVSAVAPVMFTVLAEPKLNVGGSTAPIGPEVTAAVRATLPVKPPAGVTVMVEAFPLVAPGAILTAVPLTANPGGAGGVTMIEAVPVFALSFASPV